MGQTVRRARWKSLSSRRWSRRLILFYKMKKNLTSLYTKEKRLCIFVRLRSLEATSVLCLSLICYGVKLCADFYRLFNRYYCYVRNCHFPYFAMVVAGPLGPARRFSFDDTGWNQSVESSNRVFPCIFAKHIPSEQTYEATFNSLSNS